MPTPRLGYLASCRTANSVADWFTMSEVLVSRPFSCAWKMPSLTAFVNPRSSPLMIKSRDINFDPAPPEVSCHHVSQSVPSPAPPPPLYSPRATRRCPAELAITLLARASRRPPREPTRGPLG